MSEPEAVNPLDMEALREAGYDLIPLHRWNYRDGKGHERGKSPRDAQWRTREYPWSLVRRHANEGGNVGVRLRATDLVVDYDPRNAPSGDDVLVDLELTYGVDLSSAPCVETGSGGLHYYFRLPEGVRVHNALDEFPGVEFKSLGRQVVAPGSVHPCGVRYRWRAGAEDTMGALGAPQAPADLVEAVRRREPERAPGDADATVSVQELVACLDQLEPEEYRDHDRWLELMMAAHAATAGEGRAQFVAWSASDPEYADQGEEIATRWDSLTAGQAGGITLGTLYKHVLDAGGAIPPAPASEDFQPFTPEEGGPDPCGGDEDGVPFPTLERTKDGKPKPTLRNALSGVGAMGVCPEYDELHDHVVLRGDLGPVRRVYPTADAVWGDNLLLAVRRLMLDLWRLELPADKVQDAVKAVALERPFNPLTEWLDTLEWDGKPRLEGWLTRYAGVHDSEYSRAVGRIMLLGAVARAYVPGIKYDTMVVLEGVQGTLKSSLLVALGGEFTLEGLPNASDRDVVDAMRGYWIVEMEELSHLRRREINDLKAFLSRTRDRARLAYERNSRDFPRRCVFVGTTNDARYLRDSTGNRRFLPVAVGRIDLEAVRRDREQLWAEAVREWRSAPHPAALTLPRVLWAAASAEQEQRRLVDPWEDAVSAYLAKLGDSVDKVSTEALLFEVCRKQVGECNTGDFQRLSQVMQRFPDWEPGKFRFGDGQGPRRGYKRASEDG